MLQELFLQVLCFTLSVQTGFACLVLSDLVQSVLSAVLVLAICPLSLRNVHLHDEINSLLRNRPENAAAPRWRSECAIISPF